MLCARKLHPPKILLAHVAHFCSKVTPPPAFKIVKRSSLPSKSSKNRPVSPATFVESNSLPDTLEVKDLSPTEFPTEQSNSSLKAKDATPIESAPEPTKSNSSSKTLKAKDATPIKSATEQSNSLSKAKDSDPTKSDSPPEPGACCGSGCSNCVWISYAESLSDSFKKQGFAEAEAAIRKNVEDPSMRAYLLFELRMRK